MRGPIYGSSLTCLESKALILEYYNGCTIARSEFRNDGPHMKTIQMALKNSEYAEALRGLLLRDGAHRVYSVERPDLRLDGVIVVDGSQAQNFSLMEREAERFVVITRKGSDQLNRIWDAGVRHVVFEGDSPATAHLAIIAAELRLPKSNIAGAAGSVPAMNSHRGSMRGSFPIIDSQRAPRCRFSRPCNLF